MENWVILEVQFNLSTQFGRFFGLPSTYSDRNNQVCTMKQVSFFSISDYVCMYIHETGQGILVNGDLRARGAKK